MSSRWGWRKRKKTVRRRAQLRLRSALKKFCEICSRLARGGIRLLYSTLLLQKLHLLIVFGIDDIQKIIQYSMKVYLLFHLAVSRRVPIQGARKSAFEVGLLRRLESTVSGLSLTRWVPVACGAVLGLRLGCLT